MGFPVLQTIRILLVDKKCITIQETPISVPAVSEIREMGCLIEEVIIYLTSRGK